jgi:hypothetical protein
MALRINHKDNSLQFDKVTAPSTPPTDTVVLYVDSTSGDLTLKDEIGTVTSLSESLPAGSNTQIQFNNSGAFGGDAEFTYTTGTKTLVIGTTGPGIINSGAAQALTIQPGAGSSQFNLLGAQAASGTGGAVVITAGQGTAGQGGPLTLKSGVSGGTDTAGSDITIIAGTATGSGVAGNIILTPGSGSTNGVVKVNGNVVSHLALTTDATTAYTLVLADDGNLVTLTNGGAINLTVPTNASVAFPIGTQIIVEQGGAGQVTVLGAGVTFHSAGSLLSLASQYSTLSLIKKATDTWLVVGDLA